MEVFVCGKCSYVTPLGHKMDWKEFPTRYNHSFELRLWYLLLHEYLKISMLLQHLLPESNTPYITFDDFLLYM
jgi:hypothetical protein